MGQEMPASFPRNIAPSPRQITVLTIIGQTQVYTPDGIMTGLGILAQLTDVTNRYTDRHTDHTTTVTTGCMPCYAMQPKIQHNVNSSSNSAELTILTVRQHSWQHMGLISRWTMTQVQTRPMQFHYNNIISYL